MSNDTFTDGGPSIPNNAVSIYGQGDAMDDFPVLKAFQQYIDAEQAKAQKRMTTLCIFFAIILAIVIGVFVLLLMNIGQRNNALNEQLFQYVMKDRDRQSAPPAQSQNDVVLKALTDSMANFQKQLTDQQMRVAEQQTRMLEQQNQALEERNRKMAEMPIDREAEIEAAKQNKVEALRLKKALAELNAERERLAREKDRLHEKEIELYRKEHYPEVKPAPGYNDDDDGFDDEDEDFPEPAVKPVSAVPQKYPAKSAAKPAPKPAAVKPAPKQKAATPKIVPAVKQGKDAPFYDIPDDDSDLDNLLGLPPEGGDAQSDGAIKYFDEPEPAAKPAKESAKTLPAVASSSAMHATDDWQFPLD